MVYKRKKFRDSYRRSLEAINIPYGTWPCGCGHDMCKFLFLGAVGGYAEIFLSMKKDGRWYMIRSMKERWAHHALRGWNSALFSRFIIDLASRGGNQVKSSQVPTLSSNTSLRAREGVSYIFFNSARSLSSLLFSLSLSLSLSLSVRVCVRALSMNPSQCIVHYEAARRRQHLRCCRHRQGCSILRRRSLFVWQLKTPSLTLIQLHVPLEKEKEHK